MRRLPEITLVAVTDIDRIGCWEALEKSSEGIEWGATLLLQPALGSIDAWNKYIIYELHKHIGTEFAMLVHADGYVIRPEAWREDFLDYDYIGAPWPLPTDSFSYRTASGELVRVGNSVSIRSKRMLELPSKLGLEWKSYFGNTNEDGFLTCHARDILLENGMKFAPIDIAKYFSKEHEMPENKGIETFAFHSL